MHTGPNRGEERSNLLGAAGVYLYETRGTWQAIGSWHPEPYQSRKRQFSASKYGLAGAVRRACQARFEGIGERLPEESADELFERAVGGATAQVKEQLREEGNLRKEGNRRAEHAL